MSYTSFLLQFIYYYIEWCTFQCFKFTMLSLPSLEIPLLFKVKQLSFSTRLKATGFWSHVIGSLRKRNGFNVHVMKHHYAIESCTQETLYYYYAVDMKVNGLKCSRSQTSGYTLDSQVRNPRPW